MSVNEATANKFKKLLDAEFEVRAMNVVLACSTNGKSEYAMGREMRSAKAAKGRLDKSFTALTLDELKQYGEYRREEMGY